MNEQPDLKPEAAAFEAWNRQIHELDLRLRPIAGRPVDVTRPGWAERLRANPAPLDEAGVRQAAEQLLGDLVSAYAQGPEATRTAIRRLFAQHPSFAWAATLSSSPASREDFRRRLILFSIQDQGRDSRDALLNLQDLLREAAGAGLDTDPALREVAAMSSEVDRYGMGSTRDLLLKHVSQ
jgi:hypothetical protein